jgi:DNA-binding transcriptional ArsR family regulator
VVEHSSGDLDLAYAALAHPVRREVLSMLSRTPARVTELAAPFDMSLAAVSKHIRVLEGAALLERRVDGREHRLSLAVHGLDGAHAWIAATRDFWQSRLDALEGQLRERRR